MKKEETPSESDTDPKPDTGGGSSTPEVARDGRRDLRHPLSRRHLRCRRLPRRRAAGECRRTAQLRPRGRRRLREQAVRRDHRQRQRALHQPARERRREPDRHEGADPPQPAELLQPLLRRHPGHHRRRLLHPAVDERRQPRSGTDRGGQDLRHLQRRPAERGIHRLHERPVRAEAQPLVRLQERAPQHRQDLGAVPEERFHRSCRTCRSSFRTSATTCIPARSAPATPGSRTTSTPTPHWAKANNSLLVLTWDEDNYLGSNQIATVFSGAKVKQGKYGGAYNHYNLLRTFEDLFGTAHAGNAATRHTQSARCSATGLRRRR